MFRKLYRIIYFNVIIYIYLVLLYSHFYCYYRGTMKFTYENVTSFLQTSNLDVVLGIYGYDHVISCPYHEDNTPSLTIYPANISQFNRHDFYCHGCGKHGNILDLLIVLTGKSIVTLCSELKIADYSDYKKSTMSRSIKDIHGIHLLCAFTQEELADIKNHKSIQAREVYYYLINERGLSHEEILNLEIGYIDVNKNTLLKKSYSKYITKLSSPAIWLPNLSPSKIALYGQFRTITKQYRYLKSISHVPFTLGDHNSHTIVLCEGYFDMVALYRSYPNSYVCAIGGANTKHISSIINNAFLKWIQMFNASQSFVLAFDNDETGIRLTTHALLEIISNKYFSGESIKVQSYNNLKDAGACMASKTSSSSVDYIAWIINTLNINSLSSLDKLKNRLLNIIPNNVIRNNYDAKVLKNILLDSTDIKDITHTSDFNHAHPLFIERLQAESKTNKEKGYIATGVRYIDERVKLSKGANILITITGQPGAGKTKFVIYILCKQIHDIDGAVLIFSLDMDSCRFYDYIEEQFKELYGRYLNEHELSKLIFHEEFLNSISVLNITEITSILRNATSLNLNIHTVIVDNLDNIAKNNSNLSVIEEESIMRVFHSEVRKLNVNFIVLIQALKNIGMDNGTNMFKGSNAIKGFCDLMLGLTHINTLPHHTVIHLLKNRGGFDDKTIVTKQEFLNPYQAQLFTGVFIEEYYSPPTSLIRNGKDFDSIFQTIIK